MAISFKSITPFHLYLFTANYARRRQKTQQTVQEKHDENTMASNSEKIHVGRTNSCPLYRRNVRKFQKERLRIRGTTKMENRRSNVNVAVLRAENRERSSWNRGSSRGMPRALPLSCHCSATVQRFIHNLTCYPRIQLWPRGHMQSAAARRGGPLIMEMISSYVPGQVVRPIRARFGGR